MLLGALAGLAGVPMPTVEPMIAASIVVFAAALLAAVPIRLRLGVPLVAVFALCHGYAHIAEMPQNVSAAAFAAGMLAGSAVLHALGLAIGLTIAWRRPRVA
jgi:urease accessory protein